MKKITTIVTVALMVFCFASCSKSSSVDLTGVQQAPNQTSSQIPEINVVSKWVYPTSFTLEAGRLGNIYIKGHYAFDAVTQLVYDDSRHAELVYLRVPLNSLIPYKYDKLPSTESIEMNGFSTNVSLEYSLDSDGLKIYFKNASLSTLSTAVDLTASGAWNFRYIVIPKTTYNTTNVDWNDFSAVATALNFPL